MLTRLAVTMLPTGQYAIHFSNHKQEGCSDLHLHIIHLQLICTRSLCAHENYVSYYVISLKLNIHPRNERT